MELCAPFSPPFGMELLASVHWVASHAGERPANAAHCLPLLAAWSPRKRLLFTDHHVEVAWAALADGGWLARNPAALALR